MREFCSAANGRGQSHDMIHVHFLVAAIGGYSVLGGDDIVFL